MQSNWDSQVVPAITGIKQAVIVLVVGAGEKDHQSAFDRGLQQLQHTGDTSEPEECANTEHRHDGVLVSFGAIKDGSDSASDILGELHLEFQSKILG